MTDDAVYPRDAARGLYNDTLIGSTPRVSSSPYRSARRRHVATFPHPHIPVSPRPRVARYNAQLIDHCRHCSYTANGLLRSEGMGSRRWLDDWICGRWRQWHWCCWVPVANDTESIPDRPVQLICPWAVGGGTDAVSRHVAHLLERELGQPVNVVNATGGSGVTGHSRGAPRQARRLYAADDHG